MASDVRETPSVVLAQHRGELEALVAEALAKQAGPRAEVRPRGGVEQYR